MTSFATFKTYLFDYICDNGGDTVKVLCSSCENTVVRLLINENVLVSFLSKWLMIMRNGPDSTRNCKLISMGTWATTFLDMSALNSPAHLQE